MDRKQSFRKPELLAPAGDLKRCKTAIMYGADAVYIGGQKFSLRSRASNFSFKDIKEACDFAKEHGARIHVTVNEIPHDEDFEGLKEYLQHLEECGVTAIIVASPSIMQLAHKVAPKLEVHCSTQMSITNSSFAKYLIEQLDLDRVVLGRECTMEEIYDIVENTPVDTEAFIHGGMCVNYSGRCTLSNRMTLRDANRGGCAQSCRWFYDIFENGEKITTEDHPLAIGSKDLCAINFIQDLMHAQVASFKIEGRMKTEYYVASIVSAYRHLIDEIYEAQAPLSEERMEYHRNQIMKGENREVCSGFYKEVANASSIIYQEYSNNCVNHGFLGKVVRYDADRNVAVIETRNPININDVIEVLEPGCYNREFVNTWMVDEDGTQLESARKPMHKIEMKIPFVVKTGDFIRRSK